MIEEKIDIFLKAPSDSMNLGNIHLFKISEPVNIYWGDEPIGKLVKGINIFSPKAEALSSKFLESDKKVLITKKLQQWVEEKISITLKPITEDIDQTISSEVRAIIFNVFGDLGTMLIGDHDNTIKNMAEHDRAAISRIGLRIGVKFFFMPNFLKKQPMELNVLLWKIFYEYNDDWVYPLPTDGRVSFITETKMPDSYWSAIGYHCLDNFAIRVDVFERVFFLARQKIKYGPFIESSDMMNPIGCNSDQLKDIMQFCGLESLNLGDNKKLFFIKLKKQSKFIKKKTNNKKGIIKIKNNKKDIIKIKNKKIAKIAKTKTKKSISKKEIKADPNSPFAVLEKLL